MNKTLIWMIMLLMAVAGVSAAFTATLNVPTAGVITSTQEWNITTNGNASNCTVYASSTQTANSTVTNVNVTEWNTTLRGDTDFTYGFNTAIFEDGSYTLYGNCCNWSTGLADPVCDDTASITVTIDNTKPTAPSALSPANGVTDTSGDIKFSATVTGSATTACTLMFVGANPGLRSYSMTHSGNNCSRTWTDGSGFADGIYSWYVIATDGTNTSSSVIQEMTARLRETTMGAKVAILDAAGIDAGTGTTKGGGTNKAVVVVLLLGAGYLLAKHFKVF